MRRPYGEDPHTPFSRFVCRQLGLVDLQCILMKDRKTFSALVETIELRLGESVPFKAYFGDGKLRGKCLVAERLGIPFYLFAHREGEEGVLRYRVERIPGENGAGDRFVPYGQLVSEKDFIGWWRENKGMRQTKGRRPAWQERLRDSYFEQLFRECGMGGGGNIDGIWFDGDGAPGAVVEIRNTRVEPLETYDPARYFKADCHTWIPCAQLARQLGVPLHLMTFEKDGARRLCGLATIAKVTTRRLFYHEGKAPCQRLVRTAEEASRYMLEERPIPIIARDPCLER